jgi:NAD(P)H-hydrate epimerase
MKIVSIEQMQAIERAADASGLSYETMMKNAGRGIANWISQHVSLRKGVIGLVGSGNNGGDTIIALTWLAKWGVRTIAFLAKRRKGDPLLDVYLAHGGAVVDLSENNHLDVLEAALIPEVVVLDGILGTGFRLPLRGSLLDVMAIIHKKLKNRLGLLVIAVDCPSGVDCDTGEVSDVTLAADHTLTMAAMKKGLLAHPARSFAGEFNYIDIGIEDPSTYLNDHLPVMIDESVISSMLTARPDSGHKGTFGTCLVIAGSAPYTGAAYLAGKAAYRAGCGLVHMGALPEVHSSLSGRLIEAVWTVLPKNAGGFDQKGIIDLEKVLPNVNAIVIGPGWGLSNQNITFLDALLKSLPKTKPLIIDADALKLLVELDQWWDLLPDQTVLTPHPGEMSVLTGMDIRGIQANRWSTAMDYAHRWQVNLVLKGAMTVIASPGVELYVNPVSDTALATAGSGDVLTGFIGGLIAQGISAIQASILGVWIHASAGKLAKTYLGTNFSVTALDILDNLPRAIVKAKEAGY